MYRNDLKGNKNYFELAGGSTERGFELRVQNYSKCKKEIQGKSTLVRVSEGSSYRESTLYNRGCLLIIWFGTFFDTCMSLKRTFGY